MAETLFKYCDKNGVLILETLGIKVTQPNDFNDPFEVSPAFRNDTTAAGILKLFEDPAFIKSQFEKMKDYPPSEGVAKLLNFMGDPNNSVDARMELAIRFASEMRDMVRDEVIRTQESWSKDFGILCLSRIADSVLMWSHYTEKHQGLVIAFDSQKLAPSVEQVLFDVKYDEKRHEVLTSHFFNLATIDECKNYYLHKSPEWAYENEVRAVCMLKSLKQVELGEGRKGYILPFQAEAVAGVKLGARCPDPLTQKVSAALKKSGINCSIERAVLHQEEYKITFEVIH